MNGLAPEYIKELFLKTSEVHTRNLRSVDNEQLRVPKTRSNLNELPLNTGTISQPMFETVMV